MDAHPAAPRHRYPFLMAKDPEKRLARRPRPVSGPVEDYEPADEDPEAPSEEDIARFSDVTVKCPECGTELFDDVALCWKCGRPVGSGAPAAGGPPLWILLTVGVLIVALLVAFRFFPF